MAQTDQVIDNAPGLAVRTDMNAAFAAAFSSSSGPVEPVVKVPGQPWFDTSQPAILRLAIRDQANATWVNAVLVPATLAAGDSIEATGPNSFVGVTGGTVHRAGDTMTGGLKVTKPWAATGDEAIAIAPTGGSAVLSMTRAAGSAAAIQSKTGANMRWSLQPGDATAEGGANAGSNFVVSRFNDAGVVIDNPLSIARANGVATFQSSMICNGGAIQIKAIGAGNSIFQCLDSAGTAKGQIYWAGSGGAVFVTNVAGGCNLSCNANGDVGANPAAGHNFLLGTGLGYQNGGGPWTALSDARIKTVQADYAPGLAEVVALRPVVYTYNGNDKTDETSDSMHKAAAEAGTPFVGLVAQEAETVMPGMVGQMEGWIDGEPVTDLRTLNNGELVYALVNAVKTLTARLEALEARP
jgi:hypothetical protein